ncbi:hypothetical protein J5N97_011491 [Dioscorea zingiberensis]|uniref:DUF4220 domain-containing protein n=1 Tax=Dioscorea zingiberensis TaxID=325984 RepID=A0A9D5HNS7_9LILI|nr:hypothetical protein J5N97_011491 [Dioscorea zingiberensis]
MAAAPVKIGLLVPLQSGLVVDKSISEISIYEGANIIGRNNLDVADKRVSREHVSLQTSPDGSAELVVKGSNPLVLKSGNLRKKLYTGEKVALHHGDILELIPGSHCFKYELVGSKQASSSRTCSNFTSKGKRASMEEALPVKKHRQVDGTEAIAGALQVILSFSSISVYIIFQSFFTLVVRDVLVAILSNYMVDIDWLLSACPTMKKIPHVLVLHGESGATVEHIKWPEFSVNLPNVGDININASFFRKFDYSNAAVRLIASVPGYHAGPNLKKWGHMKLRNILGDCVFDKEFHKSPLVYQFSSLGSLDEKWLSELLFSMSSGVSHDKSPLGIGKPLIIWPTVEDVRCSLEGYAAGSAIPSPQKNVEKEFLNKYWAKWKATHVGRWWFLLTSANLSKAAWGALQKNNSQLMIRSYELGVLFLPTAIQKHGSVFSCTGNSNLKKGGRVPPANGDDFKSKLVTLCWKGNGRTDSSTEVIQLPVPYQLPPQPYTSEDVPWSWDRRYTKKDVYGTKMGDMSSKAKALIKWLDTDAGILARIEALVVISGALMTFLALFGSYRRRSRSSAIKYSLWAAYTVTDSISAYTIGLMQTASFRNQLFVLWSAFLIIVRCGTHSISAFSIQDNDNGLSNLLHLALLGVYASFIYNSYFQLTSFWVPVEIFWVVVCMVKIFERAFVFELVRKPNASMVNTKLVSDYMHYEHELSNEDEVDPALMKGYKYLVIGEDEEDVKIGPPDYLMKLMLENAAVAYEVRGGGEDMEMPVACSKTLKRREMFASPSPHSSCSEGVSFGYPQAEASRPKTRKLILEGLLGDHKRTFRVIETELAFLYDSFYTKYAVVSRMPVTLLSTVAILVGSCWLVYILAYHKKHLSGNGDTLVTFFFLFAINFVEVWQIITYVFSDWAKVFVAFCNYVAEGLLARRWTSFKLC